jgi:L-ascorbate metabolism protein UlaG (beta-lactamase superfamily)
MEITYLGQASFKLKGKAATVVTDPFDDSIGMKLPKTSADIVTVTHDHFDHNASGKVEGEPFVVKGPGEYEVKAVEIVGVSSFHDNKKGEERGKNTIYNIKIDKINVAHLGDLGQESLTSEQIDEIGNVDILLIPVGGFFTIDGAAASKIASQLEPKIVIPMHFKDTDTKIEQLEGPEKFLKEMGKESVESLPKLSITSDKLPEEVQVVLLTKS